MSHLTVSGITEKKDWDYAVEKINDKRFTTNQHLLLAVDGTVKEFHFNAISNSAVTEASRHLLFHMHRANSSRLKLQTTRARWQTRARHFQRAPS